MFITPYSGIANLAEEGWRDVRSSLLERDGRDGWHQYAVSLAVLHPAEPRVNGEVVVMNTSTLYYVHTLPYSGVILQLRNSYTQGLLFIQIYIHYAKPIKCFIRPPSRASTEANSSPSTYFD